MSNEIQQALEAAKKFVPVVEKSDEAVDAGTEDTEAKAMNVVKGAM